jgi:catechol 2,3-dioxygenase-like lactoylglutathione lyase family enzyme
MARIRHIAIATRDPEATKQFYIEGLGLKEVGKVNSPTSEGYYLSDGHVNLAILKFKYDDPATTEGGFGIPAFTTSVSKLRTWQRHRRGSRRRVPCTVPTREQKRWRSEAMSRSSLPDPTA